MKEVLLSTKLHIPQYRAGMVHRSRFKAQFDAALTGRLLLISAPAGFGKTSLLSEWLSERQNSTVWITLDKGDNDPARFLRYLISGIQSIMPGAGETTVSLLDSSQMEAPEIEPLLTLLLNDLFAITNHVIIVLDDYHVIENKDIHNAVSFLVENIPSRVHIVVSTRSDPPLPVARWRVRGQMIEVRGDDLRFSIDETGEFVTKLTGHVLSSNDMVTLGEKTEGWAAGLQMAALSMQGRRDVSDFIRTFSGSHRYIMDYLMEEVLHSQTEDMQAFLLRTSILERLNGQLCDSITGQTGGQQRLERLENANMFLLPLDDRRHWYRYHRLFADLLNVRLQESEPDMVKTLHLRAAQWYEDNGMITDAISHSLASGDYELTAGLVEKTAITLISRGELNTLITYSEQIPDAIIHSRPSLCVNLGWTFVFAGRILDIEPLLEQAENRIDQVAPSEETRDILGNIAAQRAFIADLCGDTTRAIEMAKKADLFLARTNLLIRSIVPFILSRAYRLNGDMAGTTGQLFEVARLAREAGNIMTLSTANYDLASTWKIEGKLRQAAGLYQDTLQLAAEKNARHFGTIAKIDAGMSDLLREWNDLDAAHRHALDAIEDMKSWRNPTDLVIAWMMLSRIQQAQGDLNSASDTLEKAEQIKRNYPLFQPIGTMLETDRVKLWLVQGNMAAVSQWMDGLPTDDTGPLIPLELKKIALARVLLVQGKLLEAITLLTYLEKSAEEGGRQGKLIEILVLQALAYKAFNEDAHALASLGKALRLAEPEGYIRTFVDEGMPMAELLFAFRQRRLTDTGVLSIGKEYLARLLGAFPGMPYAGKKGLVEDLSDRELEVLRLMAKGMTNKQIAHELMITTGTVKAHTANIYRKLDADNRTRAITLARELQLLQ